MPRFSLRVLLFDFIGPCSRVWDVELLALRQEFVKKLCALFSEVLLGQVCNSAMTDISPSKSRPAKKAPDGKDCKATNHFGSDIDGISFTGCNGTIVRVEIIFDVDIESSSIATVLYM